MFHVGQKVVCVDAKPRRYTKCRLVERAIYTVVGLTESNGKRGIIVAEVRSYAPCGYHVDRFRPLIERKTDISFAHEILRKASKKKRAPIDAKAIMAQFDAAIEAIKRA